VKKNYQIGKTSIIPIDRGRRETCFGHAKFWPFFFFFKYTWSVSCKVSPTRV